MDSIRLQQYEDDSYGDQGKAFLTQLIYLLIPDWREYDDISMIIDSLNITQTDPEEVIMRINDIIEIMGLEEEWVYVHREMKVIERDLVDIIQGQTGEYWAHEDTPGAIYNESVARGELAVCLKGEVSQINALATVYQNLLYPDEGEILAKIVYLREVEITRQKPIELDWNGWTETIYEDNIEIIEIDPPVKGEIRDGNSITWKMWLSVRNQLGF